MVRIEKAVAADAPALVEVQVRGIGTQVCLWLESRYPEYRRWTLDTPVWNARTHAVLTRSAAHPERRAVHPPLPEAEAREAAVGRHLPPPRERPSRGQRLRHVHEPH